MGYSQQQGTKGGSISPLLLLLTIATLIFSTVSACNDIPPDHKFTCAQQKSWGKCGESWMRGKCNKSCGRCGGGAASSQPGKGVSDMRGRATHHHDLSNPRGACGHHYMPDWNGGNWIAMNKPRFTTFGLNNWGGDGKYNRNPICRKSITIRSAHDSNAIQRNVRVIDECGNCDMNHLDISRKLFKQFNKGSLNAPGDGKIDIIWSWE